MDTHPPIETKVLVCPVDHTPLRRTGDALISEKGATYPVLWGKVPVLVARPEQVDEFLRTNPTMTSEYLPKAPAPPHPLRRWKAGLRRTLARNYRTQAATQAREAFLSRLKEDSLFLSVGGGPYRSHPRLVNVNAGPFPNVDVVADALHLPFGEGTVDGVHCDSLLEHLRDPDRAVSEMARVLKPGGQVLSIVPFLMHFHGYPDHFQNYTLAGHRLLYERHGFRVISSGVCVGPLVGWADQGRHLLERMLPRPVTRALGPLLELGGESLKLLDRFVRERPWAQELATTTFVLAER